MGPDYQSHLCCCLDNTSPRLPFTSTSTAASGCSMPRPEELVPVLPCSCPPRGPQLFHSQVNFTSKIVLAKCTFDFHSQVTSLRSSSHSGRLATVARVSFVVQSSCSCELDTATRCHTSCCAGCQLRAWFCSWCSICSDTATRCHTSYWRRSHSTLSYLVCGASSGSTEPALATRCHLIKINLVSFPVAVLRSLSFLIPSFTKITCHLILWYISL